MSWQTLREEFTEYYRQLFWCDLRRSTYKELSKHFGFKKNCKFRKDYFVITGKARGHFTKKTTDYLQSVVDFLNTEEGLITLQKHNVGTIDHIDDLVSGIRDAINRKELRRLFNSMCIRHNAELSDLLARKLI